MKRLIVSALLSSGVVLAFSWTVGTAHAQEKILGLTSTTFKDGR